MSSAVNGDGDFGMTKIKKALLSKSLFRQCYMICLFACNISYVHMAAYGVLVLMMLWGLFLVIYNEVTRKTALRTRYGFWLIAFFVSAVITLLIHVLDNAFLNFVYLIHLAICFFIFYSLHTEKQLNFRRELFNISRIIIYATTILGIVGLACLVLGVEFEFMSVKFIIYENRFTGLYANPNQLGFICVSCMFCCHIMLKKDFVRQAGCRRISRIWIASCFAVNSISFLLSDSNGAMLMLIGYAFFFFVYKMFGTENAFRPIQVVLKTLSCVLAGLVILSSGLMLRTVCQLGFAQIIKTKQSMTMPIEIQPDGTKPELVTFEHENANVDSGRFKLWEQGIEMFRRYPVFGIGKGNVHAYGKEMFEDGIRFTSNYNELAPFLADFHNAYLMILVCYGAMGFIFFAIFGIRFFAKTTKHVLRDERLQQSEFPCMYSFLCAYVIYSFIEVALLSNIMFSVVFFWLILGYTSCFLTKNIPDHPIDHVTIFGKKFRKTLF